jgi:hypothetical protein
LLGQHLAFFVSVRGERKKKKRGNFVKKTRDKFCFPAREVPVPVFMSENSLYSCDVTK